jgi:hypothetical protein
MVLLHRSLSSPLAPDYVLVVVVVVVVIIIIIIIVIMLLLCDLVHRTVRELQTLPAANEIATLLHT